ncbi:MAG: hypothetical protein HC799_02465 [Limnothrix sp. RL_2_0]|nr:hypothetical protein [Limnothrix sp. RL_2_0]
MGILSNDKNIPLKGCTNMAIAVPADILLPVSFWVVAASADLRVLLPAIANATMTE